MERGVQGMAADGETAELTNVVANEPSFPILIRPLRTEDREPIHRLLVATGMFTKQEVEIALELLDIALGRPEQQDYVINVCETAAPVGYYCIGPTPATVGTFDLYWIAVDPKQQGKGVGAALAAHAEEVIRTRGGRLILAETSSQPKYEGTRGFYQKRGYERLALIRDYYRAGDDLIIFGKYIQ